MSTPNQPPYGQSPGPYGQQPPQGQPPQGQPPYGPQQPGFAPPNYGGQPRPGSYPTPPPPGGYPPYPGQQPPPPPGRPPGPGGAPGQPPGPSPQKTSARPFIIIGAIVLALILIGITAAVLVNRSNQTAGTPVDPPATGGPGGGPSATSAPPTQATTAPPPVSDKGDQAVKAYLDALAAGQAGVALSLAREQPVDTTFLTDAVLADSLKRAPITDIKVSPQANEYDTSISASYKIGDQQVNETFLVQKNDENYLLYDAAQDVNVESIRNRTLPLLINGVEVKTDNIFLFPGSYVFSSGNANIGYGLGEPLLIKSPRDYPNTYDYRPAITDAGTKALVAAATAKLDGCLKEAKFRPSGCQFLNVAPRTGQKLTESTLKRKLNEDPFANVEPRLDYQDPSIAEFNVTVRWEATVQGTENGKKGTFTVDPTSNFVTVRAKLTDEQIKVIFNR